MAKQKNINLGGKFTNQEWIEAIKAWDAEFNCSYSTDESSI